MKIEHPRVRFWSVDHINGTELLWDASPWCRFIYASKGTLRIHGNKVQWVLPQNLGFWVAPFGSYAVTCVGEVALRIAYFHASLEIAMEEGVREVGGLLRELLLEADKRAPLFESDEISRSLAILLADQIVKAARLASGLPMPIDPVASAFALRMIESPGMSLSEGLEQTPLSRRSLERRFAAETGMALGRWHQRVRLVHALGLLREGKSVSEASWQAGYLSPSAFIQAFHSHFGSTPGQMGSRESR